MITNKTEFYNLSKKIKSDKINSNTIIRVGMATCGIASGARKIYEIINKLVSSSGRSDITLECTGCVGECYNEPIVEVEVNDSFVRYNKVTWEMAEEITNEVINKTNILNIEGRKDSFRIVLENSGIINPEKFDDYISRDGYKAFVKALFDMSKDEIIEEIKNSGLRGRGGAGFPTWMKWDSAKKAIGDKKYIICNADEGDPGAFMDRAVLEGDPHRIIEAMAIAGYAIGSDTGIVYIRAEYPLAVKRLTMAIEKAREYGLLGKNILGSGFDFDITLNLGAGAFVCGEETALLNSIEGKRGEPRVRPPYPAQKGLFGCPTNINNVETYANIPVIIRKGSNWYSKIGTENSKGTKVFSLAGKINNVGLVEVPMGTTIREVIYNYGGGIKDNKKLKAVQTGGPSGGCIPVKLIDTKIDYDSLKSIGSIMGSGGMIIIDEDDCMVDIAKYYIDFAVSESCGKCTPCRIGNLRLYEILDRITKGEGELEDIDNLKELGEIIKETSLCGLGGSSPNPVLSSLEHFRDEYLMHIEKKTCLVGKCEALKKYVISKDKCIGCGLCARNCPVNCISGELKKPFKIDQNICIKCGVCYEKCPVNAIFPGGEIIEDKA